MQTLGKTSQRILRQAARFYDSVQDLSPAIGKRLAAARRDERIVRADGTPRRATEPKLPPQRAP